MKPTLAISCGDPAGIGPEVVAASLQTAVQCSAPVVFGHWPTFQRALNTIKVTLPPIDRMTVPGRPDPGRVGFVNQGTGIDPIEEDTLESSTVQYLSLCEAVDAIEAGQCDAIATAPVSKAAINRVHPGFTGHTEYLADRCRLAHDQVTMIFASQRLIVGLVATHLPLRDVPSTITPANYNRTLSHIIAALKGILPTREPRVAVAALNPHAGEDGLLGREEIDIIGPFCKEAQTRFDAGIFGPIPADAVFRDAMNGRYDGVAAAYHDQAMIPLKLAGAGATVNITMGLPFIRTSPDHGVAYDIARRELANPEGMQSAIEMAARLWNAAPFTVQKR